MDRAPQFISVSLIYELISSIAESSYSASLTHVVNIEHRYQDEPPRAFPSAEIPTPLSTGHC
jgi:hypothetical protein